MREIGEVGASFSNLQAAKAHRLHWLCTTKLQSSC